ncbi:MAG: hypothetical protein ACI8PZ_006855 [Myxococcota bacterium]
MSARVHPSERREAERRVGADAAEGYIERQRCARLRVALLDAFYRRYPSRMGALHELAATGIAVARFAGLSVAYDEIGDRLLPVDRQGLPRTDPWRAYVAAFETGLPADVIEERWLAAHLVDMEAVKAEGWVDRFHEEAAQHGDDPGWAMLSEHMDVTLGTRVADKDALAGRIALETAIASSLGKVAWRQATTGLALVRTYVGAAVRATLGGGPWVPPHLPSDRRLVWRLCVATLRAVRIGRVFRQGIRRQSRGAERADAAWSLGPSLQAVLGHRLAALHPRVLRLFEAMHTFEMTASVHLYHRVTGWAAVVATLLVGQGMYEQHLDAVPARFRLFRRDDGSLHFVREFWCADAVRVFDSDFVVRDVDGSPTILEVFQDLGVAARMRTEPLADGGLSMTVIGLYIRGIPAPVGPFRVCFTTCPTDDERVFVRGSLELAPRNRLERWWLTRVMRMPDLLGEIRYFASEAK